MSGLILSAPVPTAVRPNRKARLAQRSILAAPVPNMQPRQRGIPGAKGCGVAMSPIGPMIVIQLEDGQGVPLPMTAEQGRQIGVALISLAAQYELLQKMQADQAELESDGQPTAVSPEAEALLAEAIAAAGGPVALKGDEGDVDDDEACRTMQFNSYDVNGQPCWEEPASESA